MSAGKTATPPRRGARARGERRLAVDGAAPARPGGGRRRRARSRRGRGTTSTVGEARVAAGRARDRARPGPAPISSATTRAAVAPTSGSSRPITSSPSGPGAQRERRLVAHDLGRQQRAVLHVGRVRDDRVERAGHAREQVALVELDVEPEPRRVRARHVERVGARVGRDDVEVRPLGLQRQRDRARAGADVAHARAVRAGRAPPRRGARSPAAGSARAGRRPARAPGTPSCPGCRRPARARAGARRSR